MDSEQVGVRHKASCCECLWLHLYHEKQHVGCTCKYMSTFFYSLLLPKFNGDLNVLKGNYAIQEHCVHILVNLLTK